MLRVVLSVLINAFATMWLISCAGFLLHCRKEEVPTWATALFYVGMLGTVVGLILVYVLHFIFGVI
jgi:hypothetical protein